MPDSPETRFGKLETGLARTEQRLEDLSSTVRSLGPLVVQQAEMRLTMEHVEEKVDAAVDATRACRSDVVKLKDALDKRAETQRLERKSDRKWQVGTSIAAAAFVIAALSLLLSSSP